MRNQPSTRNGPPAVSEGDLRLPPRRDPVVRRIAADWRRLTSPGASRNGGGQPTLIACSGGGDSSALVIALAAAAGRDAPDRLAVAHVVHDLRPAEHALADRDHARRLAMSLGIPFVEASVRVLRSGKNLEGTARVLRYQALAGLARRLGLPYVATAHNSHDQIESVLMALLRGAGPRGLGGIAASRRLAEGVRLIRPMLGVSPAEARGLCALAGWRPAHDVTNDDPTRLRNAVRRELVPRIIQIRPAAPRRFASAAERCREAAKAVSCSAAAIVRRAGGGRPVTIARASLRRAPAAVVAETLRKAAVAVADRSVLDRLPARSLAAAVRLIQSSSTDPKRLQWSGVVVSIDAHTVTIGAA